MYLAGGLAAGLALGLLLVAWTEYRDTALRSERDIWAFTKLPTLAVISLIGETQSVTTGQRWMFGRRKPKIAAAGKPLMNAGG